MGSGSTYIKHSVHCLDAGQELVTWDGSHVKRSWKWLTIAPLMFNDLPIAGSRYLDTDLSNPRYQAGLLLVGSSRK